MLLAATVPDEGRSMDVADFGSGSGAVGMAIASRIVGANVTLVEIDETSMEQARRGLALPANARFADRVTVKRADLAVGTATFGGTLDHVLANPPFDPSPHGRRSPDQRKALAHVMEPDTLLNWTRAAVEALRPGGRATFILRPESLPELLATWAGRLSGPAVLPVHTGAGQATRILVRGRKARREKLRLLLPFLMRDANGPTPEGDAVMNGESTLRLD